MLTWIIAVVLAALSLLCTVVVVCALVISGRCERNERDYIGELPAVLFPLEDAA